MTGGLLQVINGHTNAPLSYHALHASVLWYARALNMTVCDFAYSYAV